MDKETLNELHKTVEHATAGNWIPLTIVACLLGVVMVLIIHIHNIQQKRTQERLTKSEENIDEISKNNILLDKMVVIHEERLKGHDRELGKLNAAG